MYRTVVVPVDPTGGGDVALPVAATVARQCGSPVEALAVASPGDDQATVADRLAERIDAQGVDARPRVVTSDDVAGAICAAGDSADTLLCMATRARRPIAEAVLGSVADSVVRLLRRPVLLVGPQCGPPPERYQSVVAGLDGSDLSEAILPVVADWASQLDLTAWIFQVLPERMPLEMGSGDVHETAYVQRVADRLRQPGVTVEWDVSRAHHAAPAIVDFAAARRAALIAVTTHGRSGLSRVTLGSAAGEVVRGSAVPVLVARPQQA